MGPIEPHVVHADDVEIESWPGIVSWRTLLSSDRTPTEAITLGTAEIEPGATTDGARHRHAPPEAYYVLAGQGAVYVGDQELPVQAGSAVFVPGDAWHLVRNTG